MAARPLGRVAALGALAAVAATLAVATGEPASAAPQTRPNIVLIVTDDQTLAQLNEATMPSTLELLGAQGTTFTNAIATTPLCCPSRASMITGQYGHNNGVLANAAGYQDLRDKRNVLPAWLQRAGYRTAHVGRWLQGYKRDKRVAPGWDQWFTLGESRTYFDYEVNVGGAERLKFGEGRPDYLTRVLNQAALRVIRAQAGRQKPFYLQLDQLAPHSDGIKGDSAGACVHSAIPPSRTPSGFETAALPKPPSFNEENVSDKPSFIASLPPLNQAQLIELERQHRCRLASLPAVDEGVRRIVETLSQLGELDNTAIAFVSDNGYFFGEHRVPNEKYLAYEEALRLPLLIRFPAGVAPPGGTVSAPVANIDLAPTILDLAGARPCERGVCRVMDGRSVVGLAQGQTSAWPPDRGLAIELVRKGVRPSTTLPCSYAGVRVAGQVYVEYSSVPDSAGQCVPGAEVEHYDLAADPFELQNLFPAQAGSPAAEAQAALSQRLAVLHDCSGIEGRDPAPASGHYCE